MPFDHDAALALLGKALAAAADMVKTAEALDLMIRNPQNSVADTAEAFVLCRRVNETLEEGRKAIGAVAEKTSYQIIPERMLDEGLTTFNTASGYRVTVSQRFSATMLNKPRAFEWLRARDMGDLIQENVNSQTLSAQLRQLVETENIDPPADIFKTSMAPYTSVTKVKSKG